jgi:SAM-dependent methyltransferase
MRDEGPIFEVRAQSRGTPRDVFPRLWGELSSSLIELGWQIENKPGGTVLPTKETPGEARIGRIERRRPPHEAMIRWSRSVGTKVPPPRLTIQCSAQGKRTAISMEHRGGFEVSGQPRDEHALGWFASEILAPFMVATCPARLNQWSDNRYGGRPAEPTSRANYEAPIHHIPGFRAMLAGLSVKRSDRLLEVGCGGGAFLKAALRSGCRAEAIDHSPDMLTVATKQNATAIEAGRLRLHYADATVLPFASSQFTCAVMSGVLPWLPRPVKAFREVFRTLRPGGRFVVYSSTPKAFGTPAAGPKRRGGARLYADAPLAKLAALAGFKEIRIEHPDLRPFAREAGIPRREMYLFAPEYGHLLWARRSA